MPPDEEARNTITESRLRLEKAIGECRDQRLLRLLNRAWWRLYFMEQEKWLEEVRLALAEINMPLDEWNKVWPYDFTHCFRLGMSPRAAAMAANHFWWRKGDETLRSIGVKLPGGRDPQQ